MYTLYHTLNTNLRKSDISKTDKMKILDVVKDMNEEELEAFFMLIHEHYVYENNDEIDLPYGCQQTNEGININMTKIPIKLRRILLKFVNIVASDRKEK